MVFSNYKSIDIFHKCGPSYRWIITHCSPEMPISGQNQRFLSRVTLKIDGWTWKTIWQLSSATSGFVHHFIAIGEFKLQLQSGNAQSGSKLTFLKPCDLVIWRMALKNNRAPLLSIDKLCVSFKHHMWIPIGVTVRKRLSRDAISVIGNNSWKISL